MNRIGPLPWSYMALLLHLIFPSLTMKDIGRNETEIFRLTRSGKLGMNKDHNGTYTRDEGSSICLSKKPRTIIVTKLQPYRCVVWVDECNNHCSLQPGRSCQSFHTLKTGTAESESHPASSTPQIYPLKGLFPLPPPTQQNSIQYGPQIN